MEKFICSDLKNVIDEKAVYDVIEILSHPNIKKCSNCHKFTGKYDSDIVCDDCHNDLLK